MKSDKTAFCDRAQYSNGYKASARDSRRLLKEAECELVGRGELDPKYRQKHPDEDAYVHGIDLNAQIPRLRMGNITPDQLYSLAIYVFLLVHAHAENLTKLTGESFSIDISKLERSDRLDETLCNSAILNQLNRGIVPVLKEINISLKELCEQLPPSARPANNFFTRDLNGKAGTKSIVVNFLTTIYELFKKLIDAIASCFSPKTPQPQ